MQFKYIQFSQLDIILGKIHEYAWWYTFMYNGVQFYTPIYNYMNNTITKNLNDNTKSYNDSLLFLIKILYKQIKLDFNLMNHLAESL